MSGFIQEKQEEEPIHFDDILFTIEGIRKIKLDIPNAEFVENKKSYMEDDDLRKGLEDVISKQKQNENDLRAMFSQEHQTADLDTLYVVGKMYYYYLQNIFEKDINSNISQKQINTSLQKYTEFITKYNSDEIVKSFVNISEITTEIQTYYTTYTTKTNKSKTEFTKLQQQITPILETIKKSITTDKELKNINKILNDYNSRDYKLQSIIQSYTLEKYAKSCDESNDLEKFIDKIKPNTSIVFFRVEDIRTCLTIEMNKDSAVQKFNKEVQVFLSKHYYINPTLYNLSQLTQPKTNIEDIKKEINKSDTEGKYISIDYTNQPDLSYSIYEYQSADKSQSQKFIFESIPISLNKEDIELFWKKSKTYKEEKNKKKDAEELLKSELNRKLKMIFPEFYNNTTTNTNYFVLSPKYKDKYTTQNSKITELELLLLTNILSIKKYPSEKSNLTNNEILLLEFDEKIRKELPNAHLFKKLYYSNAERLTKYAETIKTREYSDTNTKDIIIPSIIKIDGETQAVEQPDEDVATQEEEVDTKNAAKTIPFKIIPFNTLNTQNKSTLQYLCVSLLLQQWIDVYETKETNLKNIIQSAENTSNPKPDYRKELIETLYEVRKNEMKCMLRILLRYGLKRNFIYNEHMILSDIENIIERGVYPGLQSDAGTIAAVLQTDQHTLIISNNTNELISAVITSHIETSLALNIEDILIEVDNKEPIVRDDDNKQPISEITPQPVIKPQQKALHDTHQDIDEILIEFISEEITNIDDLPPYKESDQTTTIIPKQNPPLSDSTYQSKFTDIAVQSDENTREKYDSLEKLDKTPTHINWFSGFDNLYKTYKDTFLKTKTDKISTIFPEVVVSTTKESELEKLNSMIEQSKQLLEEIKKINKNMQQPQQNQSNDTTVNNQQLQKPKIPAEFLKRICRFENTVLDITDDIQLNNNNTLISVGGTHPPNNDSPNTHGGDVNSTLQDFLTECKNVFILGYSESPPPVSTTPEKPHHDAIVSQESESNPIVEKKPTEETYDVNPKYLSNNYREIINIMLKREDGKKPQAEKDANLPDFDLLRKTKEMEKNLGDFVVRHIGGGTFLTLLKSGLDKLFLRDFRRSPLRQISNIPENQTTKDDLIKYLTIIRKRIQNPPDKSDQTTPQYDNLPNIGLLQKESKTEKQAILRIIQDKLSMLKPYSKPKSSEDMKITSEGSRNYVLRYALSLLVLKEENNSINETDKTKHKNIIKTFIKTNNLLNEKDSPQLNLDNAESITEYLSKNTHADMVKIEKIIYPAKHISDTDTTGSSEVTAEEDASTSASIETKSDIIAENSEEKLQGCIPNILEQMLLEKKCSINTKTTDDSAKKLQNYSTKITEIMIGRIKTSRTLRK